MLVRSLQANLQALWIRLLLCKGRPVTVFTIPTMLALASGNLSRPLQTFADLLGTMVGVVGAECKMSQKGLFGKMSLCNLIGHEHSKL